MCTLHEGENAQNYVRPVCFQCCWQIVGAFLEDVQLPSKPAEFLLAGHAQGLQEYTHQTKRLHNIAFKTEAQCLCWDSSKGKLGTASLKHSSSLQTGLYFQWHTHCPPIPNSFAYWTVTCPPLQVDQLNQKTTCNGFAWAYPSRKCPRFQARNFAFYKSSKTIQNPSPDYMLGSEHICQPLMLWSPQCSSHLGQYQALTLIQRDGCSGAAF